MTDPMDLPEPVMPAFDYREDARPPASVEHVWVMAVELLMSDEMVAIVECGLPVDVAQALIGRISGVYCTWCGKSRDEGKRTPCDGYPG